MSRGDVAMTLNIVHIGEEKPENARRAVLRTTSKGARLRRGESIRKSKVSGGQFCAKSMLGDLDSSMDQLEGSIADMGLV